MGFEVSSATVPRAAWPTTVVAATAITVGIFGSTIVGTAGDQSGGLSQELGVSMRQYIASWNTHDATVLADYFTPDADMIMGTGPILDGRTAIQEWWRDYFAVQEPERKLTFEVLSTRSITPDVALINIRTTTGGRTARGLELVSRMARGTWVMVRQDGEWLIAAMRGMPTQQDRIIRSSG